MRTVVVGVVLLVASVACSAEGEPRVAWSETDAGSSTGGTAGDPDGSAADVTGTGMPTGGSDGADDTDTDDIGPPPGPYEPARYPGGQTHSPVTPYVADRMREIAMLGPDQQEDVFMKTGASSTVSRNTLYCFAEGPVDLGAYDELQPTLDFFLGGDAAGTTPFDRDSLAALSGRHAGWAIDGDPSPIDLEVDMLAPRLALVHFGANDMGWGDTYGDALLNFHENMMLLTDGLLDQGVVPILFGITRRADVASAQRWVDTWNATTRVIAQARQVPYVDLFTAIDGLPGHGLAGDGLHLEAYSEGACLLTEDGLQHGYNVRNLVALEVLDRAVAVLDDGVPGIDPPQESLEGEGTPEAPWVIDALPFGDVRNTAEQGVRSIDEYTGCNDTANESGPELWYRLELTETKRLRAAVLDMESVDIDVHLLDDTATAEGCIARGHHFVEGTLPAGTYHFVLDTWVNDGGVEQAGEVLFVLLECAPDDPACD